MNTEELRQLAEKTIAESYRVALSAKWTDAKAKSYADEYSKMVTPAGPVLVLFDHIAALEAENAELRKDAERYRWLRKQFRAMSLDMGGNHCWVQRSSGAIRGPSVDEAVDAALKETP